MKKMPYSTIYIDKHLKYIRALLENANQGAGNPDFQWLDNRIQKQAYDWIINSLHDLFFMYTGDGDWSRTPRLPRKATILPPVLPRCATKWWKKGSPTTLWTAVPLTISGKRTSISPRRLSLPMSMTLRCKLQGQILLRGRCAKACKILPDGPEGASIAGDQLRQCMWAIAHGDEDRFNKYLENRIKMLRRYGRLNPVPLDSWGLAAIKLANRRGIQCHLDVIELPYSLLGDDRPDTSVLAFPREAQIRSILQNW